VAHGELIRKPEPLGDQRERQIGLVDLMRDMHQPAPLDPGAGE
jgi:hypothetical protein